MRASLKHCLVAAVIAAAVYTPKAAQIDGIVATPGIPNSAGTESDTSFNCLAVIYPYSTWQPSTNSSAIQPSSSPVPPYVEGSIDFSITNVGSNTLQAPWTLGIYNPVYTEVLQVGSHSKPLLLTPEPVLSSLKGYLLSFCRKNQNQALQRS